MIKKENNNERFREAKKYLIGEKEENLIVKGVLHDKTNGQISLRIPKEICLAKNIGENSEFIIVQKNLLVMMTTLKKQILKTN